VREIRIHLSVLIFLMRITPLVPSSSRASCQSHTFPQSFSATDTPRSARSGSSGTPREHFSHSEEEKFGFRASNAAFDPHADTEAAAEGATVAINIGQMRAQMQVAARLPNSASSAAAAMLHSPVGAYPMASSIRPLSMHPSSPGAGSSLGVGQQPSPRLQELQRQQHQLQQQILAQQQIEYAAAAAAAAATPRSSRTMAPSPLSLPLGALPRVNLIPPSVAQFSMQQQYPQYAPAPGVGSPMLSGRSLRSASVGSGSDAGLPPLSSSVSSSSSTSPHSARHGDSPHLAASTALGPSSVSSASASLASSSTVSAKKAARDQLAELLFSKVRNQRYEEVEDLLVGGSVSPDARDRFGNNILMVACQVWWAAVGVVKSSLFSISQ
jgi:hypothetical protein